MVGGVDSNMATRPETRLEGGPSRGAAISFGRQVVKSGSRYYPLLLVVKCSCAVAGGSVLPSIGSLSVSPLLFISFQLAQSSLAIPSGPLGMS